LVIPLFKFGMLGRAATPFTGTISFVGGAANSNSATISLPGSPAAGDMALIFDIAASGSSAIPSSVTPSGFTAFGTSQTTTGGGRGWRFNKSYKVLVGGESSLTGMSGNDINSKIAMVFRKSAGTWATPSGVQQNISATGISTGQTVTVGAAPQAVFAAGMNGALDLALTPTATGLFDDSDSTEGGYLLQNASANNVSVAFSSYNGLCSGYIGLIP